MKIPFGLAQVTGLDIEHCALLTIIIGFHLNNKPCFMLNKPLASITGMSEKKVRQKLHNLQSAGWIEIRTGVKTNYSYFDRIITFTKDYKELEANLEKYEQKTLSFATNDLDVTPNEIDTLTDLDIPKIDMTPIQNNTAPLSISLAPPTETDTHIILLDNDNRITLDKKENSYKNEIFDEKNNQLSIINNSIIAKQNDFVNQYPEVVDLLDFSLAEVFEENKYTIDEFCKSKDFELIKKEYRMIKRNLPAPKPKNRLTLIEWYKSLGKVQVADNLYMYPYQAIILKLVFNHKYLSKMINHYDNTYFARDSKFKEYTDHYSNIVGWLKTDIEKNILKQGNNQFDRYYYYNWGVDRNEII